VAASDSSRVSRKRAIVIGGAVGAVVGGLAGAAIGSNQNAYECVLSVASCPRKPDHTLLYAAAGTLVGTTLGALLVHTWFVLGR
jgi:hypothetical protein